MKLSIEQRKIGMKYCILSTLSWDIFDKRYVELQQLYESLNLKNNKKLVDKLYEVRNIGLGFTETVYGDILLVVADYLIDRAELVDLFEKLYTKRFPHIIKVINDLENQYSKNGGFTHAPNIKLSMCEKYFFNFLIYKSEIFIEPDKLFRDFDYEKDVYLLNYSFYLPDKNLLDSQLCFGNSREEVLNSTSESDSKEKIFESVFFKKYISKRRVALAEYLGIKESDLATYIHSEMKAHIDENNLAQIRTGLVGTIESSTKNIIANNNGGTTWYNLLTGTYHKERQGYNYIPDVDMLIENYYKSYVTSRIIEEIENYNGFNKLTLSRGCIPASIEMDYSIILCMYEIQVAYKMFSIMQEQYYKDFSWEKITNQKLADRYEEIIRNLQEIIEEKEKQIQVISHKKDILSLQITAEFSKQTAPLVAENNKLLKQLEEKDSIIDGLKKQLQYQEEFIAELNSPEVERIDNTYNLEFLQSKRYLFVGHISAALPELKHRFPNSLFMEMESFSLSGIEVDGVVMLVKWMSHSMFYKIKSASNLTTVKNIMCNAKNIDIILQKMYEEFL